MTFNPQKMTVPVVKNFAFQHFNNVPLKQIERSCNEFLILLLFFYTKSFHTSHLVCSFYVKGSEIWPVWAGSPSVFKGIIMYHQMLKTFEM